MKYLTLIPALVVAGMGWGCTALNRAGEATGDAAAWLFSPDTAVAAEAMAETGDPNFFIQLLRMIGVQEGFLIALVAYAATGRGRTHLMNIGSKFVGLLKSFVGLAGYQHTEDVGADAEE
jgi:hypothetical protein